MRSGSSFADGCFRLRQQTVVPAGAAQKNFRSHCLYQLAAVRAVGLPLHVDGSDEIVAGAVLGMIVAPPQPPMSLGCDGAGRLWAQLEE